MTIAPFTLDDIELDLVELEPADLDALEGRVRWHLSTPYAIAIKSIFGEALISGMGTAIVHNGTGWIGERVMMPRFRGPELEAELVTALVFELRERGCISCSVVIAEDQRAHYEALGFKADGIYVTYAGGKCEAPTLDEVELFEPQHSMGVLHLDKLAYGEDRRELVSEHFYASRVFVSKGRVLGTYMPLLIDGLIVAGNTFAGLELLRWHLPHVTEVTLPEGNLAAVEFLQERKYTEQGRLLRMVHGPHVPWRPEMVYTWTSRTLG